MGGATLAGTLTGMTEAILHTPFSGVKNRLQAREFMHCRNSWLCVREMVQSEGSSSLYRGFEVGGYAMDRFARGCSRYARQFNTLIRFSSFTRRRIFTGRAFGTVHILGSSASSERRGPIPQQTEAATACGIRSGRA